LLCVSAALLMMAALLPVEEIQASPGQDQDRIRTSGSPGKDVLPAPPSLADTSAGGPAGLFLIRSGRSDFADRYRQWQNLSPKQQRDLRQNYRKWQDMSPRERQMYRHRHEQWQQLPPEQRRELRRKLDNWNRLPPREREQIRRRFMEE